MLTDGTSDGTFDGTFDAVMGTVRDREPVADFGRVGLGRLLKLARSGALHTASYLRLRDGMFDQTNISDEVKEQVTDKSMFRRRQNPWQSGYPIRQEVPR